MEDVKQAIKDQNRDYIFVFFIENHIAGIPFSLKLSKKSKEAESLITVHQEVFNSGNKKYLYSIYCFKIFKSRIKDIKDKQNHQINIKGTTATKEKFKTKLTINLMNINYDKYIFDFKFESIKGFFKGNIEPPESYPFDSIKQLDIYISFIRKSLNIKMKDKENDSIILSAHELFIGNDKSFEFSFYLSIFRECFASQTVQRHLGVFRLNKIKGVGKIDETKKKQIQNNLNLFEKDPNRVLDRIKGGKKDEYGVKLFAIIIYFNYLYFNGYLSQIFNNKNNLSYKCQALIEYQQLFKNLKLGKDQISLLIQFSQTFKQVKNSLSYSNSLLDLLTLVSDNFQKINKLYTAMKEECKKKEDDDLEALIDEEKIDVEEIITPNENDKMREISDLFKNLVALQNGDYFILFTESFFKKYIDYFNGKNLNNLFYLKDIISFSEHNIKDFALKDINLNRIIHENGLDFAFKGELKNLNLLEFIEKDEFYNNINYSKKQYRSLNILKGLDIKEFDEAFYSKWKKINWKSIFNEQYIYFLEKISGLIFNKKYFKIMFKLFNLSGNDLLYDFHPHGITLLQKKFIELYKNYIPENDNDEFFDNINVIILYSDKKNTGIETFLEKNLQVSFEPKLVNKIYINFVSIYDKDISEKTKNIIIKFFTGEISTQETILYLINNCNQLSNHILENIEKYNIKENDFFNIEDTENYKFFKGLLNSNNFQKKEFQNTNFVKKANITINKIRNNIKTGDINYKDISKFYEKNKLEENKLLEIIQSIFLNNKEEAEKYKFEIDTYYLEIKDIIDNLQLILEDLLSFYRNEEKEKIEDLRKITDKIRTEKLNYYKNNNDFINKYNYFKDNYLKKAKERFSKRRSIFFTNIFQIYQQNYRNNEKKCIEETEKTFEKLKDIFIKGVSSLNENILKFFLNSIKERSKEEIDSDLEILRNIFEIKEYNKEKILQSMLLLSKKNIYLM